MFLFDLASFHLKKGQKKPVQGGHRFFCFFLGNKEEKNEKGGKKMNDCINSCSLNSVDFLSETKVPKKRNIFY